MHIGNERDLDRSALVLYGTETGTSQDLAEEVGRCLSRLHFHTDVTGLENITYAHLSLYSITVFVISTTGQGDFPENSRKFWTSLLRKKLSPTTLVGIDYAVVGLCDSSYPKFNWAARKLDKRVRQLGGSPIVEPCEADEQGDDGTDGAFLSWLPRFRDRIMASLPLRQGQTPIPDDVLLPSKWRLAITSSHLEEGKGSALHGFRPESQSMESPSTGYFTARLETNDRVTPASHWQDVRFMTLTVSEKIDYLPGDALAISPHNLPPDVTTLIDLLHWGDMADTPVHLVTSTPSSNRQTALLPTNSIFSRKDLTLRVLLTDYLDINAIPRRSFFAAIANYTTDSMHKERLLEFTDPQYLDEYYDYATRPRRSIVEILQEFDTVQLPWEEVTNIIPPLRPRQFSIASGGALKITAEGHTKFELLIAIVKYRTVIKRIREGVCTKYLAQLPVGTRLEVSLKTEGRFAKPAEIEGKNHILIGAGTGIAPLRALVYEKIRNGMITGNTALIFGCRNETADFFFRSEWEAIKDSQGSNPQAKDGPAPVGLDVITAFSRDQNSKVYVQDRIRQQARLIWTFLRERCATIIVCGASGQMPKAVRQALVDAMVEQAGRTTAEIESAGRDAAENQRAGEEPIRSSEDAEKYLAKLEKGGRYKQETWS